MLALLGRIYTTISLAALPAAVVVLGIFLALFRDDAGLGVLITFAMLLIALAIVGVLGANAIVAALLSSRVPGVRPKLAHVALLAGAASLALGVPLLLGV